MLFAKFSCIDLCPGTIISALKAGHAFKVQQQNSVA